MSAVLIAAAFAACGAVAALFLFWVLWASVTAMAAARDAGRLSRPVLLLGEGFAACGLVYDIACNVLICSVLFLELPREATLSQRLRRLVMGVGWRSRFATWVAVNLVNPFSDPASPHIPLPH